MLAITTQAADLSGSALDFNLLDKNGDGKLSRSEFSAAKLPPIGAGKAVKAPELTTATTDHGWFLRRSAFGANKGRTGLAIGNDLTDKPAEISWSRKGSGSESYAIDAGLGIRLSPWAEDLQRDSRYLLWAGADYHRNSTPGGEVEQTKAGLSLDILSSTGGCHAGWVTAFDVFYKNDNVKDFRSVNGAVTFSPVFADFAIGRLKPILPVFGDAHLFSISIDPSASFVFEHTMDTGNGVKNGSVGYFKYGVGITGFLLPEYIGETVKLDGSYMRWDPVTTSGLFDSFDSSGYLDVGITYILANRNWAPNATSPWNKGKEGQRLLQDTALAEVEMGLRLGYVSGDDPVAGIKDEDMVTLTFTARY